MTKDLVKHSVTIAGHRTSISLEPEFWNALRMMAARNGHSLGAEIALIDASRGTRNLSSAIRVAILTALSKISSDQGEGLTEGGVSGTGATASTGG